jgi:hypothetical protein
MAGQHDYTVLVQWTGNQWFRDQRAIQRMNEVTQ